MIMNDKWNDKFGGARCSIVYVVGYQNFIFVLDMSLVIGKVMRKYVAMYVIYQHLTCNKSIDGE